jgi:dihydroxyacid dehydratase/phosphogluconate dehydratase
MIKFKAKSIENIAERAKERMLGKKEEGNRVGILVSTDNFSGGRNYGLKLAYTLQNAILKNGCETEIIALPTICDNYKEFTSENNLINIYKEQLANMVELILTEKSYDSVVIIAKGISSKMGMQKGAITQNIRPLVFGVGPSANSDGNS